MKRVREGGGQMERGDSIGNRVHRQRWRVKLQDVVKWTLVSRRSARNGGLLHHEKD